MTAKTAIGSLSFPPFSFRDRWTTPAHGSESLALRLKESDRASRAVCVGRLAGLAVDTFIHPAAILPVIQHQRACVLPCSKSHMDQPGLFLQNHPLKARCRDSRHRSDPGGDVGGLVQSVRRRVYKASRRAESGRNLQITSLSFLHLAHHSPSDRVPPAAMPFREQLPITSESCIQWHTEREQRRNVRPRRRRCRFLLAADAPLSYSARL